MEFVQSEESGSLCGNFEGFDTCRNSKCEKQSSKDTLKGVVMISPALSKTWFLSPNTIHKTSRMLLNFRNGENVGNSADEQELWQRDWGRENILFPCFTFTERYSTLTLSIWGHALRWPCSCWLSSSFFVSCTCVLCKQQWGGGC